MQLQALRTFVAGHRRPITIAAIVIVLLGIFLIFFRPEPTGFRVVKTNPALNNVTYLAPFIKLEYSEPITYEGITIPDQSLVKSYQSSNKTLTIFLNLDPGQIGERLTVKVARVTSTQGSRLLNQEYSFKIKNGEWGSLPEDQKKAVLDEQDKKPAAYDDPILTSLPYETPFFRISAVVTNKGQSTDLKLQADLTPPFADTLEDGSVPQETIDQYKQQVVAYIQSLGLDPAKYPIQYNIINPYAVP